MKLGDRSRCARETELGEKNLLVVERGETSTSFTVDTSEQSVDDGEGSDR